MVALAEDPAVAARHSGEIEQAPVAEAGDDVGRRVDERLDGRCVVDDVDAEDAAPHRASHAVGAEQQPSGELAARGRDAHFAVARPQVEEGGVRVKPRACPDRVLEQQLVELGAQRHSRRTPPVS